MPSLPDKKPLLLSGAACCLVSALAYTACNICMRRLTALGLDPFWAVCFRELVTVAIVGPWLAVRAARGRVRLPPRGVLIKILVAGFFLEVVSNTCVQWALGVVGLAVTIPAFFGVSIAGGALLAWILLGERLTARSTVGIGLFIASLLLLGMGVGTAGSAASAASPLLLGLAAAGLGGAVSTSYAITIRAAGHRALSPALVTFLTCTTGVVSLAGVGFARGGAESLPAISGEQAVCILGAGMLNLVGFLGWLVGFQRTTVVRANMISASQVAMAGIAGVLIFAEPPTVWLTLGSSLTIFGVWWISHASDSQKDGGGKTIGGAIVPKRLPKALAHSGERHGRGATAHPAAGRPATEVKQVV